MRPRQDEPNPVGRLAVGILFMGACFWLLGVMDGLSDPASALFLGFLLFCGGLSVVLGIGDIYQLIQIRIARRRAETPTGVFGTASFATIEDCERAGLTNPQGLFLGALDGEPVFFSGKAHLVTVAPARQGKGTSVVVPNLLHYAGSVFATDPKGELAAITGRHRAERFGQKVIHLNPWGLNELPRDRYNPLQRIIDIAADPAREFELGDEIRSLAMQLEPEPPGGDSNFFFRAGTRNLLEAVTIGLAVRGRPERCTLPEMWSVIKTPERLKLLLAGMAESDALDGLAATYAKDLLQQMEQMGKLFEDFRTGATNALQVFRPGGPLADSVSASDFRFEDLKREPTTVYIMIPAERIKDYGPWLAMIARDAIMAVASNRERRPVLFLLDEFANMGRIAGLAEALTLLPGHGVRVWAILQDLSHLRSVYGAEMANVILSQSEVKQFFAVEDLDLAMRLSRLMGERSIMTRNFSLGQRDTDEVGVSISERGVPLMAPQDVRGLPRTHQLLFVNGVPPMVAEKVPYWTVSPWRDWADPNPMEGDHPRAGRPALKLQYRRKGGRG